MREAFSRSQSQSKEDVDLAEMEPKFNFDSTSWILPSSESVYEDGLTMRTVILSDCPMTKRPKRSSMPAQTICVIGCPQWKLVWVVCRNV